MTSEPTPGRAPGAARCVRARTPSTRTSGRRSTRSSSPTRPRAPSSTSSSTPPPGSATRASGPPRTPGTRSPPRSRAISAQTDTAPEPEPEPGAAGHAGHADRGTAEPRHAVARRGRGRGRSRSVRRPGWSRWPSARARSPTPRRSRPGAALHQSSATQATLRSDDGRWSARVVVLPDRTGYLRAVAMPETEAGHDLQLWSITPAGPVSAGLLRGSGAWHQFRAANGTTSIAVTEEPRGGSPSPTGSPIVSGEVERVAATA